MKHIVPIIASLFILPYAVQAQSANPFKSIGKKTEMLTLSNGRYQETFDDDLLQRVGTVVIDRRTKRIVKMLDADSINNEVSDNSTASRWYSVDPHAEKYVNISPYAFVANNPINSVDPNGADIVVLNNPNGASGYGHMAILIGNDKTGWMFISKEGRQKDHWYSNEVTGGPALEPKIQTYTSLDAFQAAQKDDKDLGGYSQNVRFATDSKQDETAISATTEAAKSWYNVIFSNCADAVSDGLKSVNIDPGYTKTLNGKTDMENTSLDPKPNVRFEKIKANNKDIIIPTTPATQTDQKTTTNTNGSSSSN